MSEFIVSNVPNVIFNLSESVEREESKANRMSQEEAYAVDMVNKFKSKKNIEDPLMTLSQLYMDEVLKDDFLSEKEKLENYKSLTIDEYCTI